MGILYYMAAQTGETYKAKDGSEKKSTVQIGKIMESANGNKFGVIDCLPVGASGPIMFYLNEPRTPGSNGGGESTRSNAPRGGKTNDSSDDIPF